MNVRPVSDPVIKAWCESVGIETRRDVPALPGWEGDWGTPTMCQFFMTNDPLHADPPFITMQLEYGQQPEVTLKVGLYECLS